MSILAFNPIITAALVSCVAAQLIKALVYAVRNRKFKINRLFGAGGNPSSHSAVTAAAAVMSLRICGAGSSEFAFAVLIAAIVMYDTSGIRYNAGLHAKRINRLREFIGSLTERLSANKNAPGEKKLNEMLGSRPVGVFAGMALGAAIALILPI
ncbi:MAG: divergent PAP2 family protein [Lachnospiraceae bacterium]|nr:divergent PAP2 family protein [Ruminococcus sp.]MCM1276382.1 divergent PAP2 family protein [Lachnospiraceae bacterium]